MASQQEKFLKRILLVVDGSQTSEETTAFALRMAKALESELVATYVIDTATMDYLLQMHIFVAEEREDFEEAILEKGTAYLKRTQKLAQALEIPLETAILRGRLHQEILRYVRQKNINAIVIGGRKYINHGKDIFSVERDLLLELATIPVILVK